MNEAFCPHGIRDGATNCIACEDPTKLSASNPQCDVNGGCPELRRLRAALVRIANVEERPALIASQALGLVAPDDARPRAYYETHDPPHCPTCGCGTVLNTEGTP